MRTSQSIWSFFFWYLCSLLGGIAFGMMARELPQFQTFVGAVVDAESLSLASCLWMAWMPWVVGLLWEHGVILHILFTLKTCSTGLVFSTLFWLQNILTVDAWIQYILLENGLYCCLMWFWMGAHKKCKLMPSIAFLFCFSLLGYLKFYLYRR